MNNKKVLELLEEKKIKYLKYYPQTQNILVEHNGKRLRIHYSRYIKLIEFKEEIKKEPPKPKKIVKKIKEEPDCGCRKKRKKVLIKELDEKEM